MPRRIFWLPSLTLFALSACGGSDNGFFSDVASAGAGGASHAGAASSAGATSRAGSPSSAGTANNAGSSNSAGSAGSSSSAGSAGKSEAGASSGGAQTGGTGSGGHAGISSSAGAAGRAGSGGSGASAGHAGASGGSAGVAGNSGANCEDLLKQASQQLEAARVCNLELDALQCTGKVTNQCGCQVPVQKTDSSETKAYLKTLRQLEDNECLIACTAIACASVTNAQCRGSSGSSKGSCVATSHGSMP